MNTYIQFYVDEFGQVLMRNFESEEFDNPEREMSVHEIAVSAGAQALVVSEIAGVETPLNTPFPGVLISHTYWLEVFYGEYRKVTVVGYDFRDPEMKTVLIVDEDLLIKKDELLVEDDDYYPNGGSMSYAQLALKKRPIDASRLLSLKDVVVAA